MRISNRLSASLLAYSVLFLSACSGDTDPTEPEGSTPASITLSSSAHTFAALGDAVQLAATVKAANGQSLSSAVTWMSSNTDVVRVVAGSVTAVGNGSTQVTASVGSVSASATVTVQQVATTLTLTRGVDTLRALGDSAQVTASLQDAKGNQMSNAAVQWASSNPTVATVGPSGVVTAVANGAAQIAAAANGLSTSVNIIVSQRALALRIAPFADTLVSLGQSVILRATANDSRNNPVATAPIAWTSANTSVATVSEAGVVTGIANGTAGITATAGALHHTATVTVRQVPHAIAVNPASVSLTTVGATAELTSVVRDARGHVIADGAVEWTTSASPVASVSVTTPRTVVVTAVSRGQAVLTARSATASTPVSVAVTPGIVVEAIDPYLATPAPGHQWEMPVLVVRYLPPSADGAHLDIVRTGFPRPPSHSGRLATLQEMRNRIDVLDRRVKFMLEEGSRYRGYANPSALPSLGYRIVHYVTIYEPLPKGPVAGPCAPADCTGSWHFPDYHEILSRVNAKHWVETRGVKEIWVWGYHFAGMVQPESNMSSPTTGDISNSYRWNDDLPVFNRTYTLYGYNFGRGNNEAVHNHGHQLEAILGHVESNIFWKDFVGQSPSGAWRTGRSGWTHMPPNTTENYDYHNPTPVLSDIEDWRAEQNGNTRSIGSSRWRDLVYSWPAGSVPTIDGPEDFGQGSGQRTEAQWYIYWMQNMPGRNNGIPFFTGQMTNWWQFTGDWDAAMGARVGLATVPNGLPITIRNDFSGGVHLSAGGGLAPGETRTLHSRNPVTVSVWNCGKPGATACLMDPYELTPGRNYRVASHPNGPSHNLVIVEQ